MATPTLPIALSVPSLTVLQSRTNTSSNRQDDEAARSGRDNAAPPAATGRGRLIDIVV